MVIEVLERSPPRAFRQSQRNQQTFLPPSIEEFVGPDDPVRAYDAFVDALDVPSLGLEADPHQVGCPPYPPTIRLKILVYGYSYGIRSSRKLERALHHNLSFIWLAGGLKPDFKTIARFRRQNRQALKGILRDCARLCLKLGVTAGNTLFVDGSKFRAHAGNNQSWTAEQCEEHLRQIDQRIEELLHECERVDSQEAPQDSPVHLQEELAQQRSRQERIATALAQLPQEDRTRINLTDPDCNQMRGRQGAHAGYNSQIVVDEPHGLIVQADVVSDQNDRRQFAPQIAAAAQTTGKTPDVAGADNGYYSGEELEPMTAAATEVLVPARQPAAPSKPFAKGHFTYLADENVYVCPAGQRLPYRRTCAERQCQEYQLDGRTCGACAHYKECTRGRNGRKIVRYFNEDLRDRLRQQFALPAHREIYRRRKETAELPFGHIKRNLGAGQFLLRGLSGVRAEMSLLASCFNVARLLGLFGVAGLMLKLSAL
jgi:transposase